ncbi:MAG TPA: serine hydrolase, partial [Methylophilaceae bacterium]|nr:serine hydrolase [Methylophilaceae bacterium]
MTNHNILDSIGSNVFEGQAKMFQKLAKKLTILIAALALIMPPIVVEAAQKKSHKRISASCKHSISSRRIFRTIRADRKYQVQRAHYNQSLFQDDYDGGGVLQLASSKALIVNQETGETLYAKSTDLPTPIASVTKLMTAMVMLDAHLPMDETIVISQADADVLKGTTSRLRIGTELTRAELLQLALMASENRAAAALGRSYPGG